MKALMDKKTVKRLTAVFVSLVLMFTFGGALRADAFLHGLGNHVSHENDGITGGLGNQGTGIETTLIKTLIQLNLTDAQKQAIAAILKKYKPTVKQGAVQVLDARKNLFEAIHGNVFDEGAVRNASKNMASAEEELAVLRAKIVSEVRAVLTPEQITTLDKIKADISAHIKNRVDHIQYLIDLWIQQHS